MDEEDEDVIDIFADEGDPLLYNMSEQDFEEGKCSANNSEEKSDKEKSNKIVDEATALAELPDYTPLEKDKECSLENKTDLEDNGLVAGNIPPAPDGEGITKLLTREQKIDSRLSEIISDNRERENRKRQFDSSMNEVHRWRDCKQKYMIKNGVQLCLRPRKDIATLSGQQAGDELARCLDEVSKCLV